MESRILGIDHWYFTTQYASQRASSTFEVHLCLGLFHACFRRGSQTRESWKSISIGEECTFPLCTTSSIEEAGQSPRRSCSSNSYSSHLSQLKMTLPPSSRLADVTRDSALLMRPSSRSSRAQDTEEFSDDSSTLAEDAKLLEETPSPSSFFTRSRSPRRSVSHHRLVSVLFVLGLVSLSSLLTYAFATRHDQPRQSHQLLADDRKVLVLASYKDQNVNWLQNVPSELVHYLSPTQQESTRLTCLSPQLAHPTLHRRRPSLHLSQHSTQPRTRSNAVPHLHNRQLPLPPRVHRLRARPRTSMAPA